MTNPLAIPMSQGQFAVVADLSQPAVSELIARGTLRREAMADEWMHAYIRNLREVAAGRMALGDLDLATERARLAKEQADRIALQNQITRRELVPVEVLTELVSGIAAQVGVIFDALPGKIKRESPDLPANALDTIARELAKGRNAIASMKIDDVLRDETPSINDLPITEIT